MDTKFGVLKMLEQNRGSMLSGQQLALGLGVTRAAVWKAIKALVTDGYDIASVHGEGYALAPDCDKISEAAIRAHLPQKMDDVMVVVKDSSESTNIDAAALAAQGAPNGSVVVALQQSAGQGRIGKSFASPVGGIYFSVVLRLNADVALAPMITPAAAVAVSQAFEKHLAISPSVKWVNDIFVGGKKVCGISAQATADFFSRDLRSVIVGIGINYTTPTHLFPPELRDIAASLYPDGDAPPVRNALIADIVSALADFAESLVPSEFMPEYRRRCFVIGKRVKYAIDNSPESGIVKTVADDGSLEIELDDGTQRKLGCGEISILF